MVRQVDLPLTEADTALPTSDDDTGVEDTNTMEVSEGRGAYKGEMKQWRV